MGNVSFDDTGRINDCQVLRLENDRLRLDVLPEAGGKILHWIDKSLRRDWLWQHPQISPARHTDGTIYDDVFCSGWDELFPNGDTGFHAGVSYPDHGEYWNQAFAWDMARSGEDLTLRLSADGPVTRTRMQRCITMGSESATVKIRYRLTHLGNFPLDYLWSLHPALNINPNCELVIPGEHAINGAPGLGRLAAIPLQFRWPLGPGRDGQPVDLSKPPARGSTSDYDMTYITQLREGWFALTDTSVSAGFGIAFDHNLFGCAWVFQTHGGWRGIHTAIVEPCTGHPTDLAQAAAAGQCARLMPGQVLETQIAVISFTGNGRIRHLGLDGSMAWHQDDSITEVS
jgi:hypothetical protein